MKRMRSLAAGAAVLLLLGGAAQAQSPAGPGGGPGPHHGGKAEKGPRKPAAPAFQMVMQPQAVDILKAMSAKLAAAKTMSFVATVGVEAPSRLGPPLVFSSRYEVTMARPDRLRVIRTGDGPASEFYDDGKVMMAYAPAEDLVAVADAPPTVEAALKKLYDSAATYFPFTDLLVPDPAKLLVDGGKLAFVIGPSSVVGGVTTDMIAWADDDVFVQMWIGRDDKLPRRARATYRNDPDRLRHDMELSNWVLDGPAAAEVFTSAKAKAGKPIAFGNPAQALAPQAKGKPGKPDPKSPAKPQ